MRSKERLDEILHLIRRIWVIDPDMRFLQLIYVLQAKFSEAHAERGKIRDSDIDGFTKTGFDLFNTEDDELINFLEKYLKDRSA